MFDSSRRILPASQRLLASRAFAVSFALVLFVSLSLAVQCQAGVAEFTGDLELIDAPAAVTLSSLEDDFLAKLFVEQKSVFLEQELLVDVTKPGGVSTSFDLTPTTLVDRVVNSYLVHADPLRFGYPAREYTGSITFEEDILGIMVTGASLDASDRLLGSEVTRYVPPEYFRGFEGPGFRTQGAQINDTLKLSEDLRTVKFHFMTTSRLDQLRIVTGSNLKSAVGHVPEPSTGGLLIVGLVLARVFVYRRAN